MNRQRIAQIDNSSYLINVYNPLDCLTGWIHFESHEKIDKETAMKIQDKLGYHPNGYGFSHYVTNEAGTYWKCASNCE